MLKNKVIIVTGGAGKLGKAFVKAILKNGGIPVIADLNLNELNDFSDLLSSNGLSGFEAFQLDITSQISINKLKSFLHGKYGRVDALVNNAYPRNSNYGRRFEEVKYEDFCENISMHLGGYFLMSQIFSQYFAAQGYGNIINISSIYGVIAPRFEIYENTDMTTPVEYAVIKSGLIHLSKYIAKYYKKINIRVNCISPGGIWNNQPNEFINKYNKFALTKGMLNEDDLIGALLFLLSENSKHVNGHNLIVDDGWTL